MPDDAELLRGYSENDDQAAFAEFVRRHIDFVYGAALRQAHGDTALAADAVQVVFIDAARKAGGLAGHAVVLGWLHTATRFAVAKAIRTDARRHAREHTAWTMNEALREDGPAVEWERLQPELDAVLGELKERERAAILLRFFDGRSLAEVGAKLALSEPAARSCVDRALEKMRDRLARRGITSTGAALGLALANQAVVAAPAGLAASVTSTALAGATAAGALGVFGTFFAMSKIKDGVVSVIVVAALAPAALEMRAHRELEAEVRALRASGGDLSALQKENRELNAAIAKSAGQNPDVAELARLRARAAVLQKRPDGVLDSTLKPAATWRNAGWVTPEAALETTLWASEHKQTEEILRNCGWVGDAKPQAEAAFAKLSDAIRARYGSADRLWAEFCFGSRGAESDAAAAANYGRVAAVQILNTSVDLKRGGMRVSWWEQKASGHEYEQQNTFVKIGDRYGFGDNRWSDEGWKAMIAEIDPVTLAFRPRKIVPMDPETGRPVQPKR
jgi:RNA polymerase sigma factor (sigma-70 family)